MRHKILADSVEIRKTICYTIGLFICVLMTTDSIYFSLHAAVAVRHCRM